ncbi:plasmid replication initiation factor [Phycisphaerales bacterium AB-hyl4]|uniref:Plasmid replication initiation factor n=1 Tax=Natronomicrosphaera hydrolytica TaxID=3242702 RepID=A0ABV4U3L8_9BACT
MASSVTRHTPITGPDDWTLLNCGLDSLDLGVYVAWGERWPQLLADLEQRRSEAEHTSGIRWRDMIDGPVLILPSGKPPMYRFHLQSADFHLYIGKRQTPFKQTPNLYVSFTAHALWRLGPAQAVEQFVAFVAELGGEILGMRVSRSDLCADFLIPGGVSLDFIRSHRVSLSEKTRDHCDGDVLESFYVGQKGAPTQLRIYDKAREVLAGGTKMWFLDLWGLDACRDVWRVEYQLRRTPLKAFAIHCPADLSAKLAGLWSYLTEQWASLRLPVGTNTSRRPVHPWWQAVQLCAERFGEPCQLQRVRSDDQLAQVDWYVTHIGGCLVGLGVRLGVDELDHLLLVLSGLLGQYWQEGEFEQRYLRKAIQHGIPIKPEQEGEADDAQQQ